MTNGNIGIACVFKGVHGNKMCAIAGFNVKLPHLSEQKKSDYT